MPSDADEAYEDVLAELLDFVAGSGKYAGLGRGDSTRPGDWPAEDERHALLAELNRRGLVRRRRDGDAWAWEATGLRRAD
jgi:hypothetical protein